ncbi:MAG: hypothetical protein IPO87_06130 [Flavobacteriales bacterium]|nr:hypothetical protein [Flavobacteriales bacterium]
MTKVKLLGMAVVVLVMLNVGTLAMLFLGRPGHHRPQRGEGPKAVIIERLQFDPKQVESYEVLIKEHQAAINLQDGIMMATRSALYLCLEGSNMEKRDSLLSVIAAVQWEIEETHVEHFGKIRALCRADQLSAFDTLSTDLAGYFSRGKGGPPKKGE